jgi:hypothetical protein
MDDQRHLQARARQEQQALNARRRVKLRAVAIALRDPDQAPIVIAEARECVNLWREQQLCSRDYIDTWDNLLNDPAAATDVLDEQSPWADQLRQNSPFVAVVRKFRVAHAA